MPDPGTTSDRDAITANFRARQRAMVDADIEQLRTLSTPDSRARHINGYNQPREEWFDQVRSGHFAYHAIDNETVDITLTSPTTATLVARSTIDVTIGGARGRWRLETTTDYIKTEDRWLSADSNSRMR